MATESNALLDGDAFKSRLINTAADCRRELKILDAYLADLSARRVFLQKMLDAAEECLGGAEPYNKTNDAVALESIAPQLQPPTSEPADTEDDTYPSVRERIQIVLREAGRQWLTSREISDRIMAKWKNTAFGSISGKLSIMKQDGELAAVSSKGDGTRQLVYQLPDPSAGPFVFGGC